MPSSSNAAVKAFAPTYSAVARDEPVLRSVVLQTGASSGLKRRRTINLAKDGTTIVERTSSPQSFGAQKIASMQQQRWKQATFAKDKPVDNLWKVLDHNVPTVPPHFPIMATHATVNGEKAASIAKRIERCLQEWSISARFNSEKAKAVAETSDRVRFCIRMFRDDCGGIIVEVQRRTGGCMGFHSAALGILRAAQDLDFRQSAASYLSERCTSMVLESDSPIRKEAEENCELDHSTKYTKVGVDAAECLMKSRKADVKLLGAESLKILTNSTAVGEEVSRVAAHAVLTTRQSCSRQVADYEDHDFGEVGEGGSRINHAVNLTEVIKAMVELPADDEDSDSDSHDNSEAGPLSRYMELLPSHALSIITNSTSVLSNSGELQCLLDDDEWYEETLVPLLLRKVSTAKRRPHDAREASRCLYVLADYLPVYRSAEVWEGASTRASCSDTQGQCFPSRTDLSGVTDGIDNRC